MSDRILRSKGNDDDDDDDGNHGATTPTKTPTNSATSSTGKKKTGIPADHQEAEEWHKVQNKKTDRSIGTEKSTRYKSRIQINMNILDNHNRTNMINVPFHQRKFCTELFRADQSANILKWEDEEKRTGKKTNPITTIDQLPMDKKSLLSWIAGSKGVTDRNNKQTLQFFLYVETSVNYSSLRKALKPWLESHQHRMFITQLSTTNNRLLAWVKGSHPDWTRLEDLRIALQNLVVNQDNEYNHCELDLRPRRIRFGKGPQALFVWTIGITCGLNNVHGYMRALWTGLSQDKAPINLKHVQILPIHPIPGLINNHDITSLARNHDNLIEQLRKKSIIGFADIFSQKTVQTTETNERTSISLQEFLLQQQTRSKTALFHSVESRGKNGYLVIYKDHLQTEVEDFFLNLKELMKAKFENEFVEKYFKAIQTHLDEIEVHDDNSAVSTYSAGEAYLKGIKAEVQSVSFVTDEHTTTTNNTQSIQSGKYQSKKRGQTLNLGGYGDDVSSLGSKSTRFNAWATNKDKENTNTAESTQSETASVATLRTEVQEWLEDLKEDNKIEWEQNINEIKTMNSLMKDEFKETLQSMQDQHAKELREQRDMFKDLISNHIKDIVNQTVVQQFEKHHAETNTRSPMRKQQKTNDTTDGDRNTNDLLMEESDSDDITPRVTRRHRDNINSTSDTQYSLPHRNIQPTHLRILFININGIFSSPNKTQDVFVTAKGLQADIIGLAETNTDWKKHHIKNKYQQTLRNLTKHYKEFESWRTSKTTFTTSQIKSTYDSQRGGTTQTTLGKWVGRITDSGQDERLGRWSWQTYKGDTTLTIITAYRVCQEKGDSGPLTAHAQQHALLLNQTNDPDPRNQFLHDMKTFITQRRNRGEALILMLDANEESLSPNSQLRRTMDSISMTNLHHLVHGDNCPNTYQGGKEQIDHIYGCPMVAANVKQAGVLPFQFGIDTDHRGLYVDIDVYNIFKSNTAALRNPPNRKISSKNGKQTEKLNQTVLKRCQSHNIQQRLQDLTSVPPHRWTIRHQATLNKIDEQFTSIVLNAEVKTCHKSYGYPQSEKLIKAGQTYRYWKARANQQKQPTSNLGRVLQDLEGKLNIPQATRRPTNFTQQQLKEKQTQSRKELRHIQQESKQHREDWLQEQARLAAEEQNIPREQALKQILAHEYSKNLYRRIAREMKEMTRSAVYFIDIPADGKPPRESNQWKEIRDAAEVHQQLLEQSEEHYRLAQNTPFGKSERATHLDFIGTGETANQILSGTYNFALNQLNEPSKAFIKNLQRHACPSTMPTTISMKEVYQLFRKWDENTSTSPSTFHLGLYKTLIESEHILSIITMLMNLPLKHGTTLRRWEKSIMCMIEKERGKPRIHRLRLIHLFEADMNGIAKIIWARRFIYHCQKYQLLHHSQHGGLPGMETQHVLLKFRMTIDSSIIMKHNLAITNNDAEACFDRIIPAINGISHMSKGMPENAINMQNKILLNMKYHVRTAHGVSDKFWTNSKQDPKFGLGQGGGWSPAGCASLSSDLIRTHEELAQSGMTIRSVANNKNSTYRTMDAFVDDANTGVNDGEKSTPTPFPTLLRQLELTSQQWEQLLNVSGGSLNLDKCFSSILTWIWSNEDSRPATIHESEGSIRITNSSTHQTARIKRLEPNEAFKLLGVWVQLQGPMTKQFHHMERLIAKLSRDISAANLSHHEALVTYKQIAFKKLEYCLPMTIFTKKELGKLQRPFTVAFLSNSGYHSGFPRDLVYAPERYGGIGMESMFQSRGILQIKYLLSHIRQHDELGKSMVNLIEQVQILSGTGRPILEDTMTQNQHNLEYIPHNWILTIREFLSTFQGTIEHPAAWRPTPQRLHDIIIMDEMHQWTQSKTALYRINACRVYLQVLTVADITEPTGQYIEPSIMNGTAQPKRSTLFWPRQAYPSKKCWATWRKAIRATIILDQHNQLELKCPLGAWTRKPDIRYPTIIDPRSKNLYIETATEGIYDEHQPVGRFSTNRYQTQPHEQNQGPEIGIPTSAEESNNRLATKPIHYKTSGDMHTSEPGFQGHIQQLPEAEFQLIRYVTTIIDTKDIADILKSNNNITLASDGSKKTSGGTYGWIMENQARETIAEGMGTVHGKMTIMTSHRSELYGMTSVILYLSQISQYYGIKQSTSTITIYCDNQEVVSKAISSKEPLQGTGRYVSADYDIESLLRSTIFNAPFTCEIEWVKGHQDETSDDLDYPAKLNVAADELAEFAYMHCIKTQENFQPFPTATASLKIQGIRVTSKMKRQIEDAIHIPNLKRYRCKKYGWTEETWDCIDWNGYNMAIKPAGAGLKRFLHRYTSEWLPVGARTKYYKTEGNETCHSCKESKETHPHLFGCRNARRRDYFLTKLNTIMEELRRRHTYQQIWITILRSIIKWTKNEIVEAPIIDANSSKCDQLLRQAVIQQNDIGWEHVLKGWLSKKWTEAQEEYYVERAKTDPRIQRTFHNGISWSKTIVVALQNLAFDVWKFRNKDIYGHTKNEEEEQQINRIRSKVRQEYDIRLTYPTRIQWRYFTRTLQDRLQDRIQSIQAWYNNLHTALKASEERPMLDSEA